jgi:hypothetical protein
VVAGNRIAVAAGGANLRCRSEDLNWGAEGDGLSPKADPDLRLTRCIGPEGSRASTSQDHRNRCQQAHCQARAVPQREHDRIIVHFTALGLDPHPAYPEQH